MDDDDEDVAVADSRANSSFASDLLPAPELFLPLTPSPLPPLPPLPIKFVVGVDASGEYIRGTGKGDGTLASDEVNNAPPAVTAVIVVVVCDAVVVVAVLLSSTCLIDVAILVAEEEEEEETSER
jgi:hypothetical protein